jgi:hypothetical protein
MPEPKKSPYPPSPACPTSPASTPRVHLVSTISPSNPAKDQPAVCMDFAGIRNGKWVRLDPSSGFERDGYFFVVNSSQL